MSARVTILGTDVVMDLLANAARVNRIPQSGFTTTNDAAEVAERLRRLGLLAGPGDGKFTARGRRAADELLTGVLFGAPVYSRAAR